MKRGNEFFLFLIDGGMELTWLYAWATFLTMLAFHQSFPFQEAIGPFALAAALTLFSKEKGWWVIQILGLHLFGFILAGLRIVYVFNADSHSFWDKAWLIEFLNHPRSAFEWMTLLLLPLFAVMFWLGGTTLARRPMAYTTLCSRFDLGITAFFLLFLTKFLMLIKGGMKSEESLSQLLFFQFFVLGLLAVGLARDRGQETKEFLPGYQSIGVILSFSGVILLFGGSVVLFFLPYLKWAAEVGYRVLKVGAKPFGYALFHILRFLYMPRGNLPKEPPPEAGLDNLKTVQEIGWLPEIVEKILGWGLGSLLGLAVFGICGLVLFYLFRWLFSRTPARPKKQNRNSWSFVWGWVSRFKTLLILCWTGILHKLKGYKKPADFFSALLSWGRRSGVPRAPHETPREYGLRLKSRFPFLEKETEEIIQAFHHEVYGEIRLDGKDLAAVRWAWRRLRSPLHWPSRLNAWFRQSPSSPIEFSERPPSSSSAP